MYIMDGEKRAGEWLWQWCKQPELWVVVESYGQSNVGLHSVQNRSVVIITKVEEILYSTPVQYTKSK